MNMMILGFMIYTIQTLNGLIILQLIKKVYFSNHGYPSPLIMNGKYL